MANIYYDLIHAGLKSIDDVPMRWRDTIQALLDADAH